MTDNDAIIASVHAHIADESVSVRQALANLARDNMVQGVILGARSRGLELLATDVHAALFVVPEGAAENTGLTQLADLMRREEAAQGVREWR